MFSSEAVTYSLHIAHRHLVADVQNELTVGSQGIREIGAL